MASQRKPLHILTMSSIFYPKVDGSVIAVSNLIKCLHERGHKVHLITRRLPQTPPMGKWQGIPVIRVGPHNPSFIFRLMLSLNQARAGMAILRKERIDVIHAHGACSLLAGLMLGKLFHKPVVITSHGIPRLHFKWTRWRSEYFFALTYPFNKLLANLADVVIAQSQMLKEVIAHLYRVKYKKIWTIPHLLDIEHFEYTSYPKSTKPIVLFVGSLSRVHGPDLLIKAAPIILKNIPQTKFLLVGKGPRKEHLKKHIKNLNLETSVFLVNPILDRRVLAKYYAAASVVVIPLYYKGYILSLVALEAMSTGRPLVTTMTLDPSLQRYGVYMVRHDPKDLALAIEKILLLNKDKYLEVSSSARRYVEEECSKEVVASKLENLYRQLIR